MYRGGKTIALYRPLSRIPVLIPAGSILPLAGDYMTSHEANPRVLEVRVYHGANGSFTLVEDDCSGRRDAPVQNTRFVYTAGEKEAALEVSREGARVAPEDREYQVTIFGVYNPDDVWLEGGDQVQWQYNGDEKTITVRINGQPEGFVLHLQSECEANLQIAFAHIKIPRFQNVTTDYSGYRQKARALFLERGGRS